MNTLPERFAVKVDPTNPEIAEWFNSKGHGNYSNLTVGFLFYPSENEERYLLPYHVLKQPHSYTLITSDQFLSAIKTDLTPTMHSNADAYDYHTGVRDYPTAEEIETPKYYDNSKGSIYKFCLDQKLNAYQSDAIKRIVRCEKKGEFFSDIKKSHAVLDLYEKEQGHRFKGDK